MKRFQLNDGIVIPSIGFGVFMIEPNGPTYEAVREAIRVGYRHIDTAAAYFNESDVGRAIRESGLPREDFFVTSKLWLQDYGYEGAKSGIDASLLKLGLDYMDLYLLHQPYGDLVGAWRALEEAKQAGKIRSIGVSNMTPTLWKRWIPQFESVPSVNQVEFNPLFQQKALRELIAPQNVLLEAWYPLGHGAKELLECPAITVLAAKYGKNPGQIILRFEIQEGVVVLPKSSNPERMASNLDVFDFEFTPEEMTSLRALDTGKGSHDPDAPGVGERLLNAFDVHKG